MASKMKWSKEDRAEFAKIRKNFNAKITRLKGTDIEAFLPNAISQKDIYSRDDFHRIKKYAAMFTERDSQKKIKFHGEEVPEFFKKQTHYIQKVENARRAAKRKQFTPERGTSTMAKEAEFTPMKLKGHKSVVDLLKARERLERMFLDKQKHLKAQLYKDNYLKTLAEKLGPLAGPITELIQDLPAETIAKALEKDYELSIDFLYDYVEAVTKAEALFNMWFGILREKDPKNYTEEEQAEQFEAAYEDVMGDDWEDITERSSPIRGISDGRSDWKTTAPEEIAQLFEEKRSRNKKAGSNPKNPYTKKRKVSVEDAAILDQIDKNVFKKPSDKTRKSYKELSGIDYEGFSGDEVIKAVIELENEGIIATPAEVLKRLKRRRK